MSFLQELDNRLYSLGVLREIYEACRQTGVTCGVAYGLLGPKIVEHLSGERITTYEKIFGQPKFDGEEAPTRKEMAVLESELRERGFLP